MAEYLQLHALTTYGASNMNRDDTGQPKTTMYGGVQRIRISSQSLKRAWRTAERFREKLHGHFSTRTRLLGEEVRKHLVETAGVADEMAVAIGRRLAGVFGKVVSEKHKTPCAIEQVAPITPEETKAAYARANELREDDAMKAWLETDAKGRKTILLKDRELILAKRGKTVDLALNGRMLADTPGFNREGAMQVAHAFTTHKAVVEPDYYTTMDDLKGEDDAGAGFLNVQSYGWGVFYIYAVVELEQLLLNLEGDEDLRRKVLGAWIDSVATVSPRGKQTSYASNARASLLLAERGRQQPRSLAEAFLDPVGRTSNGPFESGEEADGLGRKSAKRLLDLRSRMDQAYGPCSDGHAMLNILRTDGGPVGSLNEVIEFATADRA